MWPYLARPFSCYLTLLNPNISHLLGLILLTQPREDRFPNFGMYQNQLQTLLKHKLPPHLQSFCVGRVGLGPEMCTSRELPKASPWKTQLALFPKAPAPSESPTCGSLL